MNNPSPLIPQGSLLEQKNKSRARVKVAFFCVVGVHVVAILVALLAQGCKREPAPVTSDYGTTPQSPYYTDTNAPAFDATNAPVPPPDTNAYAHAPIDTNYVPPQPPTNPVVPDAGLTPITAAQEYAVQKGDSFYTIGKKFNVTIKALQAANPTVNPSKLQINQKLQIPAASATPAPALNGGAAPTPSDTTAHAAAAQVHVVKAGDNLTKIAAKYGTTVNAIRRANNMSTTQIKVGDKLKIPAAGAAK